MHTPPDRELQQPRLSIRMDARPDAMTRGKLNDFATAFHRSRAAVVREAMQWGLKRG